MKKPGNKKGASASHPQKHILIHRETDQPWAVVTARDPQEACAHPSVCISDVEKLRDSWTSVDTDNREARYDVFLPSKKEWTPTWARVQDMTSLEISEHADYMGTFALTDEASQILQDEEHQILEDGPSPAEMNIDVPGSEGEPFVPEDLTLIEPHIDPEQDEILMEQTRSLDDSVPYVPEEDYDPDQDLQEQVILEDGSVPHVPEDYHDADDALASEAETPRDDDESIPHVPENEDEDLPTHWTNGSYHDDDEELRHAARHEDQRDAIPYDPETDGEAEQRPNQA